MLESPSIQVIKIKGGTFHVFFCFQKQHFYKIYIEHMVTCDSTMTVTC